VDQGLIYEVAMSHSLRHTTFGRNPMGELSARHQDVCCTTHNIPKRQTSIPAGGFEPTIPASERPYTHASNRATIGIIKPYTITYTQP